MPRRRESCQSSRPHDASPKISRAQYARDDRTADFGRALKKQINNPTIKAVFLARIQVFAKEWREVPDDEYLRNKPWMLRKMADTGRCRVWYFRVLHMGTHYRIAYCLATDPTPRLVMLDVCPREGEDAMFRRIRSVSLKDKGCGR